MINIHKKKNQNLEFMKKGADKISTPLYNHLYIIIF